MNKKGFVENWPAFFVLSLVGYVMCFIMFSIWGRMEFVIPLWQKIVIFLLIPVPAFVFTRMWFE